MYYDAEKLTDYRLHEAARAQRKAELIREARAIRQPRRSDLPAALSRLFARTAPGRASRVCETCPA